MNKDVKIKYIIAAEREVTTIILKINNPILLLA